MKKLNLLYLLLLLLPACTNCEVITYDKGKLPADFLALSPYKTGEQIRFRHSAGHVISFDVFRQTRQEKDQCAHCCPEYLYEVNTSRLMPDYPVFSLEVNLTNRDEVINTFEAKVGNYSFYIPIDQNFMPGHFDRVDQLDINNVTYKDVFRLKSGYNGFAPEAIYVDSLYYNFTAGILKIIMSNQESYEIHE